MPGPKVDPSRGKAEQRSITLYPYQVLLVEAQGVGFSKYVQQLIDMQFTEREVKRAQRKAKGQARGT